MIDPVDSIVADIDLRPGSTASQMRRCAENAVSRRLPLATDNERAAMVNAVTDRLLGVGPIQRLLRDDGIDEVIVHAGSGLWIDRAGQLEHLGTIAEGEVTRFLERALAPIGRRLDRSTPMVDARLPDGTRLCAVVEPVAVAGTELTLRRHRPNTFTLEDFCGSDVAGVIIDLLDRRANIVVTGATSSGKTSMLAAMMARCLDGGDRVVLLEDTAEISANGHLVRFEARPANAEGTRPVPLDDLLVTALRMRPDRLVVGEIRGDEIATLVQALNTGHDGSMATCHANGPVDALNRLAQLVLRTTAGWPMPAIVEQLHRSIDAVIHLGRGSDGHRNVVSIAEPTGDGVRYLTDHGEVLGRPSRSR
ncbi:MAG: ATPase, T2SS/T4P/T4SS family [Actinomycetota bacterium]|nr:ATPase, T2SS/T4P/T4SS family [Actinomycetota bacterium]MDA3014387.1 ATPase, T2SS/T4P/T4SS family [Actinomycetota bacterium]MDA3028573.1 ATPase, T2SS/T4P/T4SS family [Actinomycetota bacterium]